MRAISLVAFMALACCGDTSPAMEGEPAMEPDASLPPGVFVLEVNLWDVPEPFRTVIDGETATLRTFEFRADELEAIDLNVEVYFKETGTLIDSRQVPIVCFGRGRFGDVAKEVADLRVHENGQAFSTGNACHGRMGGVGIPENGDFDCLYNWETRLGERCGFRRVHEVPELLHFEVAPAGSSAPGDDCSFGETGEASFDDCQLGYGCVLGRCRRLCQWPELQNFCTDLVGMDCKVIEGYESIFIGACLPRDRETSEQTGE